MPEATIKVIPYCPECHREWFYPVAAGRNTYCRWCARWGDSVKLVDAIVKSEQKAKIAPGGDWRTKVATDRLNQLIFRLVNTARDLQRAQLVVQASRQLSSENRQMLRDAETSTAIALSTAERELREHIDSDYIKREDTK